MEEAKNLKGTTTVGLVSSDGIVLAADKRATMGFFIANREVPKIYQIDDRLGVTIAGSVADAQALVRIMKAEAQLYKMNYAKQITASAATTLLSNLMFQYKVFPFLVQVLVAGFDDDKPKIFNIDPIGGVTEEKFVSTGSGSPVAYGLLEDTFKEEKSIKDNIRVALRAISVAMRRDCGTGDGVDVVTITNDGFRRYEKEEIKKIQESK